MAQTALQKVQQELATKEFEQWVRSELEKSELREKLGTLEKTVKAEDNQESRSRGLKLNFISENTFGMTREGNKIMSTISVAAHQVEKNLSGLSENSLVHLDIYADYLREKDPTFDSRAVRALLTTGREGNEGRRTLYRGLWPIPDPDECGWHKHLHENSRDECKRPSRPDLQRTRRAQGTTNWTQCHA